jgi:hypothetical protein
MSIAGSSSGDDWKTSRSKVHLHELAPVGGRPASRRDRRRFERFAEVREDLPNRPGLGDEGDGPDTSGRQWAEARTQFQRWNCVLPAVKRDPIGELPILRRSGRTDVGDLEVSVNALTPLLRTVCAVG